MHTGLPAYNWWEEATHGVTPFSHSLTATNVASQSHIKPHIKSHDTANAFSLKTQSIGSQHR